MILIRCLRPTATVTAFPTITRAVTTGWGLCFGPAPKIIQGGTNVIVQSYYIGLDQYFSVTLYYQFTKLDRNIIPTLYKAEESADGQNVYGSYQVHLPDGRLQTVKYTADHYNGYVADVSYTGEAKYPSLKAYNNIPVKNYRVYDPASFYRNQFTSCWNFRTQRGNKITHDTIVLRLFVTYLLTKFLFLFLGLQLDFSNQKIILETFEVLDLKINFSLVVILKAFY